MKLVKILSDKVQIRSDHKEFDDVRINDLIAVSDGSGTGYHGKHIDRY